MDYHGYAGGILYVDLSTGQIEKQPLDIEMAQRFLGGSGINYRLEYDILKPGVDPLSPDNPIIIGAGPLVGTLAPAAGKVTATMKFPNYVSKERKRYIVATAVGGSRRFGIMLKNAGYDHVVITGRTKKPSYLKIIDDDVEICDASDLWGKKDIYEAGDELATRHRGKTGRAGTWVIGKAGENKVTYALGFVDKASTMGRWGSGAVMGSKNLKAVVTLGTKGIKVADSKWFMALIDRKRQEIMAHPRYRANYPREILTGGLQHLYGGSQKAHPPELFDETKYGETACAACIDACRTSHEIREGMFKGTRLQTGHFLILGDAQGMLKLKLGTYGEKLKLVELLNRAGLCHRGAPKMLHWVTRLFERGVISTKDTGGLVLKTGDFDSYVKLLDKWINREDVGEYMAQGWLALSKRVGMDASRDAEDGATIVRGSDILSDFRYRTFSPAFAMASIVRPRPQHLHQWTYFPVGDDIFKDTYWPEWKRSFYDIKKELKKTGATDEDVDRIFTSDDFNIGRIEKHQEDLYGAISCLGFCDSASHWAWQPMRDINLLADLYSAATGFKMTPSELKLRGERAWNMEALLNVREGIMGKDYDIPDLVLQQTERPNPDMPGQDWYIVDWLHHKRLSKEDLYQLVDDYYDERGWDIKKRIPTIEKLRELGIQEFAEVLAP